MQIPITKNPMVKQFTQGTVSRLFAIDSINYTDTFCGHSSFPVHGSECCSTQPFVGCSQVVEVQMWKGCRRYTCCHVPMIKFDIFISKMVNRISMQIKKIVAPNLMVSAFNRSQRFAKIYVSILT